MDSNSQGDMYVWDTVAGTAELASKSALTGLPVVPCGVIAAPSSVTDGGAVCFETVDGLTTDDTNDSHDIYLFGA